MTRASLREYAAVQRERYQNASRLEKHRLLDEMVAVTGLHRKAAIRLLRRVPRARAQPGPGGRPRRYGAEVAAAAAVLWQASGRIGAHRLQPFVAELLDRLTQCGDLTLAPPIDKLLRQVSRPTLARLLAPARAQFPHRGATTTRPGTCYSITWSAWRRIVCGIVKPSAFAVLRLITSSNFVGCSTGRSPGFAPFKILSTYEAARRNRSARLAP